MSITIKDIARESGYAVGTVSRVLNNRPDVSDTAREKIMEVVEKYNFRLNSNAKHLRQQATKAVAVIVKGSRNMLFASILEQIQGHLQAKGFDCLTYYIKETENELDEAIQICKDRRPLGILFLGSNNTYFEEKFGKINIPCVMVTNSAKELNFDNLSSVSTDDTSAAAAAIDYLVEKGHKAIGILGGDLQESKAAISRFEGCCQSLKKYGIDFDTDTDYATSMFSAADSYRAMNRLLNKNSVITAVFAMSDVMAMGAIRAITDRGLSVPGDISVTGFDGIELSQFMVPKLTTVRQNSEKIASRSVEILLDNIENNTPAIHEFIPFYIISGESTKQL